MPWVHRSGSEAEPGLRIALALSASRSFSVISSRWADTNESDSTASASWMTKNVPMSTHDEWKNRAPHAL
eukprot:3628927-Rhodomonas_salina.6